MWYGDNLSPMDVDEGDDEVLKSVIVTLHRDFRAFVAVAEYISSYKNRVEYILNPKTLDCETTYVLEYLNNMCCHERNILPT